MRLLKLLFILLMFQACSSDGGSQTGTVSHPTKANLPSQGKEHEYVISADKISLTDSFVASNTRRLENLIPIEYQADGLYDYLFGSISDIIIDDDNRIYILDETRQEIAIFDDKGKHITTLGGRGKGPGEFEHARSMTLYNDETLLVSSNYKIEIFDISGSEFKHNKTLQLDYIGRSICTIDDVLFVHYGGLYLQKQEFGKEGELNMIRTYSLPEFEPLFSFGEAYKSDDISILDRFSIGKISCNETTSTVVFGFERFPVLHGYSIQGSLKWKTYISGLETAVLETSKVSDRLKISHKPPKGEFMDLILKPISLKSKYELFQIDRIVNASSSFENKREQLSFIIDSETGKGEIISTDIPLLFGISDSHAISVHEIYTEATIRHITE